MNYDIDARTLEVIEELGGNFFAKGVRRYTRLGGYISLWKGVLDPQKENLAHYDEYAYQNIKIYISKALYVADIIAIRVRPKIPIFARHFDIFGVATWPIAKDGSVIVKSSESNNKSDKTSNQTVKLYLKKLFNFKELTTMKMIVYIIILLLIYLAVRNLV